MSADFQHELLGSPSPHPASNPSQDLGPLTFIDPNWIHDFSSNHLVALPPTAFGDALEVEPRIDTLTPVSYSIPMSGSVKWGPIFTALPGSCAKRRSHVDVWVHRQF